MSRRYDERVEVRRHGESPGQFLWRGRLYVVRSVLGHWAEAGAWWCGGPAAALLAEGDTPEEPPAPDDPVTGAVPASTAVSTAATALLAPVDATEREVWRVEASRGRGFGPGVFDLAFDPGTGGWRLARALD